MLRYIMEQRWSCNIAQTGTVFSYFTINGDAQAVEKALNSGGYGENGCDIIRLVGVEVIEDKDKQEPV